ncbi:hypothetical protein HYC85_014396 [Camellia sinensis]|uniref:Uncharacterized protein n=1 Tax=Camellia sinensis TaxID=4442 RepID=A0A7J7H6D2_CAMSI|nr:hypothetical protein HYC85_014396 [Camellia sinensis]
METDCTDNSNWLFDYGLIEGEDYTGALPATTCFSWPSQACDLGVEFDCSFGDSEGLIETGSRKRAKNGPRHRILFLRGRSFEFQEESGGFTGSSAVGDCGAWIRITASSDLGQL